MESIITALIYAVAREHSTPRTLSELAASSGIEKREIGRAYRYICRQLQIRILPAKPKEYIPRFASLLGLSGKVQAKAKEILKKAADADIISGKGPTGIAASSLYIAAVLEGEKRTQRDIADVVGVTEVTIRNRYKDLVEKLGIEDEVEKKAAEIEKRRQLLN
jgi:transcription initiation factor TFIIB